MTPWVLRRRLHRWAWPHGGDEQTLLGAATLVDVCSFLAAFVLVVAAIRVQQPEVESSRMLVLGGTLAVTVSGPLVLRKTANLQVGALVVMAPCIVGACVLAVSSGGLTAPIVPVLVVTPTLARLSFGARTGWITLWATLCIFVLLLVGHVFGTFSEDRQLSRYVVQGLTTLAASSFIYAVIHGLLHQVHQARAELERRDRLAALGTLAAGVAHEINNPLAVIRLNAELLGEEVGSNRHGSELLADVVDATRRIESIVSDLRVYSRSDDEPTMAPVRLMVAAGQSRRLALARARVERPIRLEFESDPWVIAHEGRLVQLLVNLFVNALQALRDQPQGEVVLSSRLTGHFVELTCRDTGPGLPSEDRARLLEPFFTTRRVGEGTGLGLYIVHTIVTSHGGELHLEDAPGGGALIRFTLPAIEAPQAVLPWSEGEDTIPNLDHTKPVLVLVVDDDRLVARAVGRVLEGNRVAHASDGAEALERLRHAPFPDAVLLDLAMPGMSGAEVYAAMETEMPHLVQRVAFLTGGATTRDMQRFLDTCQRPVLEKPAGAADLVRLVRELAKQ